MKCVAFLTYNTVNESLSNGWQEGPDGRRAFVLQNTKGDGTLKTGEIGATNRVEQISTLWTQLQEVLNRLDHIVVYVGARGSEPAITLAAKLPASKITFVACDCNLPMKELLIQSMGLREVGRLLCECGGHRTMQGLYNSFMQSGELLPRSAEPDTVA
ncbi:MAG: hypothetical protein EXS59_02080 [Candidatus Taylorbacteria bacterium]|nr:hypothetical protein [Candidatus Taylorbacteria bacterium]